MNRKILQKAIDAIKANKTEYAMGILETLIEGLPEEIKSNSPIYVPTISQPFSNHENIDEGAQMDKIAAIKASEIKRLTDASLS